MCDALVLCCDRYVTLLTHHVSTKARNDTPMNTRPDAADPPCLCQADVSIQSAGPNVQYTQPLLTSSVESVESVVACPLQIAMRELAHSALMQHVLYLEGECLPRPDLLRTLDGWSLLHRLIHTHICVACRIADVSPVELETALETIVPLPSDSTAPLWQRDFRAALTVCAQATSCPLGLSQDTLTAADKK